MTNYCKRCGDRVPEIRYVEGAGAYCSQGCRRAQEVHDLVANA